MIKSAWVGMLVVAALLAGARGARAEDTSSIGTHSDCKKLKGKDRASCTKCLNSGDGFFNKVNGKWQCGGDLGGNTVAKQKKGDPWPKAPTAMPEQQKSYATIPAGTFHIGTPVDPDHPSRGLGEYDSDVTITRSFMMKTTEVTEGEWFFVMKELPEYYKKGSLDRPVVHVSWLDAIAYLNALSKLEKLEACYTIKGTTVTWKGLDCTGYRLPTEAEWEYAGRAGTKGPTYGPIDEIAWHRENGGGSRLPVGGKKANAWGLLDMLGGVAEWTWDAWREDAFEKNQTDPVIGGLEMTDVNKETVTHTYRGTWFGAQPEYQTIAYRNGYGYATMAGDSIGIRPVRTVKK